MLELHEFQQTLLTHDVTPVGPIPTVHDPDGVYPYPSFAETSRRPVLKSYRFITLENESLRVTICPDLGGKVCSLLDKRSDKEALFSPASIQPTRILPRSGFIPGGIEVSFPISHSPVQLELLDFQTRRVADRLCLCCGERELHFGMQWTVEYSLGAGEAFLTQRTCLQNPTAQAQPWMSWSNAALPARPDTEFHFPNGPVLYHGADLKTMDWASHGPRCVGDLHRMAGFFWLAPEVCAFGAFTPSLGHGLYHIADPAVAPGIKLWSYGVGAHEIWGKAASVSGETYLEIQGGPIPDQSVKELLYPGQTRCYIEFWLPSSSPLNIRSMAPPAPVLAPLSDVPWFDWPPRGVVRYWLSVLEAHARRALADLPVPPALDQNLWAPSGMEALGEALLWAADGTRAKYRDGWLFQLGAWLAARGQVDQALNTLVRSQDDRARALTGRLHLRARKDPTAAIEAFRTIESVAFALHPQVMIERDLALAALGSQALGERAQWFARVANSTDEWLLERKAALLLDQAKPEEARALLERVPFQLVHQRYSRTGLWSRIKEALNLSGQDPASWLGEDDLALFGAYREFAPDRDDRILGSVVADAAGGWKKVSPGRKDPDREPN